MSAPLTAPAPDRKHVFQNRVTTWRTSDVAPRRSHMGDAAYVLLALSGWLASNILITAGIIVAAFFLLGNATLLGFFTQIDAIASHFVAADELRRSAFSGQLIQLLAGLLALISFFRRGHLFRAWTTLKSGAKNG